MKVSELIAKLLTLPQDYEVVVLAPHDVGPLHPGVSDIGIWEPDQDPKTPEYDRHDGQVYINCD